METETTADSGFDIGAAMDSVATALSGTEKPEQEAPDTTVATTEAALDKEISTTEKTGEAVTTEAAQPAIKAPPKSWAKDMHEHWSKLDPKVQDYYEQREKQMLDGIEQYKGDAGYAKQVKEALQPYQAMLRSQGVDDLSAVKFLMNAHYKLTNGTEATRRAAYEQIGRELGFVAGDAAEQAIVDPTVKALQDKLERIESGLSARQEAEQREVKAKHMSDVESFAADAKNVYFGEVANDMVGFINQGMSLQDAYDRAIYSNPVTRSKELARLQTEAQAKLLEKAKPEVEAARKATAVNVRGAESRREPTEPKGSMEETMREQLATIKRRVN